MSDRSLFHKIARIVYRLLRVIYVSVIFYLIPFVVFFIQYWFASGPQKEGEEFYMGENAF